MPQNLLTRRQLKQFNEAVPRSRSGLRKWINKFGFPRPYYLNANTPVWDEQEILQWFEKRPRTHFDAKEQPLEVEK